MITQVHTVYISLSVNSRYGNIGGSVLSPAMIGGIVSGVVVLIALILLVTVVLVLVGRVYYRRKPNQRYSLDRL